MSSANNLAFSAQLNGIWLEIWQGDIFEVNCEAIVNAANEQLSHGGGLALLISQKAGSGLDKESREWIKKHGNIRDGEVAWTDPHNLGPKFKKVIHAVGPQGPDSRPKRDMMFSTIIKSITKANEFGLNSIVFPALSVGIFNYPKDIAAQIHLDAFVSFAGNIAAGVQNLTIGRIAFAVFQADVAQEFIDKALEKEDCFHMMNYFGLNDDLKYSLETPQCKLCKIPAPIDFYQVFSCCMYACDFCFYTSKPTSCPFCNQPVKMPNAYQDPNVANICRKCKNFYYRNTQHTC